MFSKTDDGGAGGAGAGVGNGALSGGDGKGNGAGAGDGGDTGAIDWDKITVDEYFNKFKFPEIEGVSIGADYVKKTYGEFVRKHHISPEALSEYLQLEGNSYREAYKEAKAEEAKEVAAIKKNFEAQGEALKKAYTPAQIDTAVSALSQFSDDKDFMDIATTNLSNNKTLVKLLLNWAEHNSVDGTTGAGKGAGESGLAGFAERWTGKKL